MRRTVAVTLCGLLVVMCGCAAFTSKLPYDPMPLPVSALEDYRVLEIAPVTNAEWSDVSQKDLAYIRSHFVKSIAKKHLFDAVVEATSETTKVLVIHSEIDYNTRETLKDGLGKMRMKVKFVDKASGATLAETRFRGKSQRGWFWSHSDKRTGAAIAGSIGDFIQRKGLGPN